MPLRLYHNASTRFTDGSEFDSSGNWYQYTKVTRKRTNGASSINFYKICDSWKWANSKIIIKDTQLAWVSFIIKINYHTNSPTSIALNKETAIPLTRSFQTFLPMTDDFSPPNNEL